MKEIPEEYESWEWQYLRESVLANANYICADCGGLAETAHHLSYRQGIICDEGFLVALCWDCHNRRHGRNEFGDYGHEDYGHEDYD